MPIRALIGSDLGLLSLSNNQRLAMRQTHRKLSLEGLEPRAMFSADLQSGLLTVVGTNKSDSINIGLNQAGGLVVDVNGHSDVFPVANVTYIAVIGKNGNDTITVAADVLIDVAMYGGNGNDKLTGGGGDDALQGGNGKDRIVGGSGDDYLYGNNANDRLFGGDGDDMLDGGNGNDYCEGDEGDDRLQGGRGDDTLDGGDGSNLLDGGAGKSRRRNGTSARLNGQFQVF